MRNSIILILSVILMLTGCGLHKEYTPNVWLPAEDAFGMTSDVKMAEGDTSLGSLSWRDFFTDPLLQQLIEQVLANNTDLNSARIAIEKPFCSVSDGKSNTTCF